jgi:hypothetical protein
MSMSQKGTYAELALPVAVREADRDARARVVPAADHAAVESLDDLLARLARLEPDERDDARRVRELRLEEAAALDLVRRDERGERRLVDAQRQPAPV